MWRPVRLLLILLAAASFPSCAGHQRAAPARDHTSGRFGPTSPRHAIVIDASYQGTLLHVYTWPLGSALRDVPHEELSESLPAFHRYPKGGEELVQRVLRPLIRFALSRIPLELAQRATPLWLQATSHGMDMIPSNRQYNIMQYVAYYLSSAGFDFQTAEVLPELDTALLGWVAANVRPILDPVSPRDSRDTTGVIQISAHMSSIAFVDEDRQPRVGEDNHLLKFPNGPQYLLYSHFFEHHGLDSAWDLFHIELIRRRTRKQPCLPAGLDLTYPHGHRDHIFNGTGDPLACLEMIRTVLFPYVPCAHQPCGFDGSYLPESRSFVVYPQHHGIRALVAHLTDAPVGVAAVQREALRWLTRSHPSGRTAGDPLRAGFWLSYLSLFLAAVQLSCPHCARHHHWIEFRTTVPDCNTSLGWPLGFVVLKTLEGTQQVVDSSFSLDATVLVGCFGFLLLVSVCALFLMDFLSPTAAGSLSPTLAPTAARTLSTLGAAGRAALRYSFTPRLLNPLPDRPVLVGYQLIEWECLHRARVHGRQRALRMDPRTVPPVLTLSSQEPPDEGTPLLCKADFEAEQAMIPYRAGLCQGVFMLVNTYMGVGVLCIPCAVSKAGWVLLPTLLLFVMLASTSFKILVRCYPKVNTAFFSPYGGATFANLTFLCLGYVPQYCVMALDATVWLGTAVIALSLLLRSLLDVLAPLGVAPGMAWLLASGWTVPLLLRPRVLHGSFATALSTCQLLAVVGVTAGLGVAYGAGDPGLTSMRRDLPVFGPDMAIGVGILAFCLAGQRGVLSLRRAIHPPEALDLTVDISFAVLFFLYAVTIAGTYLMYRGFGAAADHFPVALPAVVVALEYTPFLTIAFPALVATHLSVALPAILDTLSILVAEFLDLSPPDSGWPRGFGVRAGCFLLVLSIAALTGTRLPFLVAGLGALKLFRSLVLPILFHLILFQRELPLRTLLAQAWILAGGGCVAGWVILRAVAGSLGYTTGFPVTAP